MSARRELRIKRLGIQEEEKTPGNSKALGSQLQMEMGIEEHLEGYICRRSDRQDEILTQLKLLNCIERIIPSSCEAT